MKDWLLTKIVLVSGLMVVLFLMARNTRSQSLWIAELELKIEVLDQKIHSTLNQIPGPSELQKRLNRIEPKNPIKVDGRIGPETIAKYERIFCNQSAAATFSKSENQLIKKRKEMSQMVEETPYQVFHGR
jgi:hypothetical protein